MISTMLFSARRIPEWIDARARGCGFRRRHGLSALLIAGFFLVMTLNGCGPTQRLDVDNPLTFKCDPDRLWRQSQTELKVRGFDLDNVDRRAGVIETEPRTSSQWYEFWARDVVTWQGRAESSLHTLRRSVRLEMRADPDSSCRLSCRALVDREVIAPGVVSGSARANSIFAGAAGRMPTLKPLGDQQISQWVSLGRDNALEQDILQSITSAASRVK